MTDGRGVGEKILRVGAYCRVSTDKEDQSNSFENQQRYFKEYIERNPQWELCEIFADEGISGTSTKKRKAFNRMIECAASGELDLIITKEISRFARNTLDSIYFTRELKRLGIGVIFLNDNINTLDPDAELRLTIMSSIAQEESRKTSDRVKWGQRRRMEQGVVFGRNLLGYDVKGGKMYINENGAEIVRVIFQKFVKEKKGTHVIARELREAGIPTYRGLKEWSNTAILRIIRNEKYCGDLVQKKTFTPDYLSHEKKYNHGEEEFVILKNHHEPIISRELFDQANAILERRASSQEGKAKHSNRYAFSGKIRCGRCGATYVARYKKRKDGSQYKAWKCYEAIRHGKPKTDAAGNQIGCFGEPVRNEDVVHIMSLVVKSLCLEKDVLIQNLLRAIDQVVLIDRNELNIPKMEGRSDKLAQRHARLIEIYINGFITKEEFVAARTKCEEELRQINPPERQNMTGNNQENLLKEIAAALNEMADGKAADDAFYRNLLDHIVIHDKDHIDVFLKHLPYKWSYAAKKMPPNL